MKARAVAAIAVLLFAGCAPAGEQRQASPAVATVNGEAISADRFKDQLKLMRFGFENLSAGSSSGDDAKIDLLSQLIEEEMYLQEARRLNISATKEEVDSRLAKAGAGYPPGEFEKALRENGLDVARYREELGRKATVEDLIQSAVYSKVKVDQSRLAGYFKEHEADFRKPLRVRARQIVVENRKDAEAILKEIRMGADFQALARSRSFSPDASAGGDLGFFSRGDMPPEFESVVFRMKPGEVSPVVKTPYGYHIFKVEKILPAEKPTFREAEPEVRKKLVKELGEDAFGKWQEALKAKAKVEVNFKVLGTL